MYFNGASGKICALELCLRNLIDETILEVWIDLEGVAESDLPVGHARAMGELLVDELGREYGRGLIDRVGGREVIVLAGIDDDARIGIEHPAEVLVHERALHINIAEQNAVHRVVEQHVEPLERADRRDLRHAQTACIIREQDVTAEPLRDLVQRGAHDGEVRLRRIRAAETLGRGPERNEVEQRLAGRPNYRDDLCARLGRGHRRGAVLVNIPAGDDHVEQRRRQLRKSFEQIFALDPPGAHPCERVVDVGAQRRPGAAASGTSAKLLGGHTAPGDRLAEDRRLETRLRNRPGKGERDAAATLGPGNGVDDQVRNRDLLGPTPSTPSSRSTARSTETVECAAMNDSTGATICAANARQRSTAVRSTLSSIGT